MKNTKALSRKIVIEPRETQFDHACETPVSPNFHKASDAAFACCDCCAESSCADDLVFFGKKVVFSLLFAFFRKRESNMEK